MGTEIIKIGSPVKFNQLLAKILWVSYSSSKALVAPNNIPKLSGLQVDEFVFSD